MDAGKLDRRVKLLRKTVTRDEVGETVEEWTVVTTLWAERMELRTSDINRGAGKESVPVARYRIRWRAGVSTANRIRVSGVDYAITAIDEPDRRGEMILLVEGLR